MNFLALAQRMAMECAVSGTLTTCQNQSGEFLRLVTWVNQAWLDLQLKRNDWGFMRSSNVLGKGASFITVAGQASYPLGTGLGTCGVAASGFGQWDEETFRSYLTSVGTNNEVVLDQINFDAWRDGYMIGSLRTVQTRPVVVSIGPDQSVNLGPPPNALYTITADYFVAPTQMAADADLPAGLPAQFHPLIVYNAMLDYGGYEAAPEVLNRAEARRGVLYDQLENIWLPSVAFSGALA